MSSCFSNYFAFEKQSNYFLNRLLFDEVIHYHKMLIIDIKKKIFKEHIEIMSPKIMSQNFSVHLNICNI